MDSEFPQVQEFDIRGQICPSTLLTALKELNRNREALQDGRLRLVFRTDNRDSTVTIPEAAANMGYGVQVEKVDGHYVISVTAGD